eukprot:COSAG02_NODE_70_length_42239_cov_15.323090_24_plen_99_part_00
MQGQWPSLCVNTVVPSAAASAASPAALLAAATTQHAAASSSWGCDCCDAIFDYDSSARWAGDGGMAVCAIIVHTTRGGGGWGVGGRHLANLVVRLVRT